MKRLIFFLLAIATSQLTFSQSNQAQTAGAALSWEKTIFDFGDIPQGGKVEYTFKFTNVGSEPLMITNVTTQCGCAAPRGWPRDPVEPGGRGEITLSFDSSGKFGRVNKVASVVSNAVNKDDSQVLISGNIIEKKLD